MKKTVLCIMMAMFLLMGLTGCQNDKEATVWTDQLKEPTKIIVGTSPDYPPYESKDADGNIVGFDIDMINTLVSYLDEEITVEFAPMEFSTIVTAVQNGQVDLGISCFTYDADRDVIFSTPYLKSAQMVVVKADSGLKTVADLKDKTVGALLGTTGADEAKNIEGIKGDVVLFNDNLVGFESLSNDIIDAYVTDYGVAMNYVSTGNYIAFEEALLDESVSIIIKNENKLLADKVNELINQFLESTTSQELIDKWGV